MNVLDGGGILDKLLNCLSMIFIFFIIISFILFSVIGISSAIRNTLVYWFHFDELKNCYVIDDKCVERQREWYHIKENQ